MAFDLNNLQYLALEGGGGRGILYIEPINILEAKLKDRIIANYRNNYNQIEAYRKDVVEQLKQSSIINDPSSNGGNSNNNEIDETTLLDPKNGILLPIFNVNGTYSIIQNTIPPHLRLIKGISGSSAGAITAFMLSLGMSSEDIKYEMGREMPLKYPVKSFKGPISVFEQFIDEEPNQKYKRVVDGEVGVGIYPDINALERGAFYFWKTISQLKPSIKFGKELTLDLLRNKVGDGAKFSVTAKLFESSNQFENFLFYGIEGRGFFSAVNTRDYFQYLVEEYLLIGLRKLGYPAPSFNDIPTLTFKAFYNLTGVDLVLTGTNITQNSPRYFSVYHTPDFPVIEAVQISMTLPVVFRPIYVNTEVRVGDEEQRKKYAGLYVDGGMLNNYPIHAFDNIELTDCTDDLEGQHICNLTYYGIKGPFPIAGNPRLRDSECNCVLGMRLQDGENIEYETKEDKVYPTEDWAIIHYVNNILNTLLYGSEGGQIRNILDEQRTVEFYSTVKAGQKEFDTLNKKKYKLEEDESFYAIKVADFSTPAIDNLRNRRDLAAVKIFLMEEAGRKMEKFLEKRN